MPLLEARFDLPPCLSAGAVHLVQEALAKGCTYLLAQRGGWRDERHPRNEKPIGGRLWQRTPPAQLGLVFSRRSLEFLMWITAARPGDKQPFWQPAHAKLTPGDLLLLFFAHEGLRDTVEGLGAATLHKREPYMHHGLCWLAYPEDFMPVASSVEPDFAPWINGVGSCIMEALQPALLDRWIHVESRKEAIELPTVMRALGASQDRVLGSFLSAVERVGRRDLARFLLRAAAQLLGSHAHSGMWTRALQLGGQRLADRATTYQAAMSMLRHMERLAGWTRWARSCSYFDEGYDGAQLWLSDWEQYEGDTLVSRAQTIIRDLDPMRQAALAASS